VTDLKSQLSAYVTEVVEHVDVDDILSHDVVELQSPHRPLRSRVRPMWIVTAALVLVIGTVGLVPLLINTPAPPDATLDPVATTTPEDAPRDDEGAYYPVVDVVEGQASLDVTFPDGTTAIFSWPQELELAESGVFLEAAAYTQTSGGPDGRVLVIHRGPFERIAEAYGGGTLLAEYPGAEGSTVEFWRFPAFEWDYLVYRFGDWVVMAYDYRVLAEERMTEDERSMWASSLTGRETPDGFLILDAAEPLHVGGPDYSNSSPAITLRSPEGGVRLEARPCDPSNQVDAWCDPSGQIRISTPGATTDFEDLVRDNLAVTVDGASPQDQAMAEATIDLLDGSNLEIAAPTELQLSGYLFTIDVPGILSSNVDLSRGVDPSDPNAVDEAAVLETDLGNGIRLWRADRKGEPFYMTVDLNGWAAFLHVGNEAPPDSELLLSLADRLSAQPNESGVVLQNEAPEFFTTYLSDSNSENQIHLGVNQCVRELIPGSEVVEDPVCGEVIRGEGYTSWCDEEANIEVMVYGEEQFVGQELNGMTLNRTQPQGP
jgi:hypothetical protein